MINLHQRFNHYLHTDKKIDLQDVNERIIRYGWCDNGKDLTGYYVLTENHKLFYNLQEQFLHKETRNDKVLQTQ
jgi:hypothetical protein